MESFGARQVLTGPELRRLYLALHSKWPWRLRCSLRLYAPTPVFAGPRGGVMITQPTATIDAVATPSSLTERGPGCVATTRITHVPSQVPQACARRFRTDTEDVVEVREQGSAVELPLVAGTVPPRLQRSLSRLAQCGYVQAHPAPGATVVGGRSRDGDAGGQTIMHGVG
jgi:hypothetical protein